MKIFPNKLFDMEKKNSSNRPWKAEFGGIAKTLLGDLYIATKRTRTFHFTVGN